MPSHSETAWAHHVAAPPAARLPLAQRLMGFLAFSGLALGAFIAARDGCAERHPAQARNASLSTLAPIMRTGPATPLDIAAQGAGCKKGRSQAGRSAKLNPTP